MSDCRSERNISTVVETLDLRWDDSLDRDKERKATGALEDGKILFFPRLAYDLTGEERRFISPSFADRKSKNISYDPQTNKVRHAVGVSAGASEIAALMRRYHDLARTFVSNILPHYRQALRSGRTSFRPIEISGRALSRRKDDTRLHVDAFPSSPTAGNRILRLFTNVNPDGQPREWRVGSRFEEVAREFVPSIAPQIPGSAWLLEKVGATKSRRTRYDHWMLHIHDSMKSDDTYQRCATQNTLRFPAGSSWLVFTDKTSHAAMSGQYAFEQTFYVAVNAMADPSKAPLRILERIAGYPLA